MKINRTNIDKLYGTAPSDGAAPAAREERRSPAVEKDNLALSDAARNHTAVDAATKKVVEDATKPASAESLLQYKNSIQTGAYRVPAQDIATSMLGGGDGSAES